ncbi:MAG: adenylate/guanylate cyclase domain-containing protein [Candidatus Riflebacteria bacterium]|nr:adenylate/guanylate cyclase domain-containing protein [Candidatus Riflebacteria bacterium]
MKRTDVFSFAREFWSCFWPLILLLMTIPVWWLQRWQEVSHQKAIKEAFWKQDALVAIERLRGGATFESQIEETVQKMSKLISSTLDKPGCRADVGEIISQAFIKSIPKSHRSSLTKIFAFSIDENGKGVPIKGQLLERSKSVMMASLFGEVATAEKKHLSSYDTFNKRCQGIFGELVSFEYLAFQQKGKMIPCFYNEERVYIIWSDFQKSENQSGGFLLIFSAGDKKNSNPLLYGIKNYIKKSHHEIYPLLVSLEGYREKGKPLFWAPKSIVPNSIASKFFRIIAELEKKPFSDREMLCTPGQVSEEFPGWWVTRNVIAAEIHYELWIVSKIPEDLKFVFPGVVEIVLSCIIFTCWFLFIALPRIKGIEGSVPMKIWFGIYFFLVGALPLYFLSLFSTTIIKMTADRSVNEVIQNTLERFEKIDMESNVVSASVNNLCRKAIFSSQLCKEFRDYPLGETKPGPELSKVFSFFERAGYPLKHVLAYRFGKDILSITPKGKPGKFERVASEMNFLLVSGVKAFFDSVAPDDLFKVIEMKYKLYFKVFSSSFISNVFPDYFDLRHRVHLHRTRELSWIQFYDFIGSGKKIDMCILFRTIVNDAFKKYLSERFADLDKDSRVKLRDDPEYPTINYSFCGRVGTSMEVFYKSSVNLFRSTEGKRFVSEMVDAGKFDSRRVVLYGKGGRKVFIAYPSKKMPGFVLGAQIFLAPVFLDQTEKEIFIAFLLIIVGIMIVFFAFTLVSHLLNPIGKINFALSSVSQGDLSTRLIFERDDEIGEAAKAFNSMIEGLVKRKELGRFVSQTLEGNLDEIGRSEGSEKRFLREESGVILVSDIRNFTTLSENYPPDVVVKMLNEHLESMTQAIKMNGGKIDQFIGDAVVAVFSGESLSSEVQKSISSAIKMMEKHSEIQMIRRQSNEFEYAMGIGIDAGKFFLTSFGSQTRMEHNVIGDPRIQSEKLEAFSKEGRGSKIIVSEIITKVASDRTFEKLPKHDAWELVI